MSPWPAPYKAALAVSSDLDGCTPEAFEAIHGELNGKLGLDVADSFWFYNADPHAPNQMAYFAGLDGAPGPSAGLIRDALKAGWIDTLHTWGDFDSAGGFRRVHAERAAEELHRIGAKVEVWTNHGDLFHNLQGIGHPRRLGDVPVHVTAGGASRPNLEYHADLLRGIGIRFAWCSQTLCDRIGQDRPLGAWEHYAGRPPLAAALGLLESALPSEALRKAVGWLGAPPRESNDLIEPLTLRDGTRLYGFRRYGDFRRDAPEDLPELLSEANLDRLEASGGAMCLYTHLGKPRTPRPRPLLDAELEAFRRLADRHRQGRIWVARTSRLLRRALYRRSLRDGVVDDPVLGRWTPEPAELRDLGL